MKKISFAIIAMAGLAGASTAYAYDQSQGQGPYILGGVGQVTSGDSGRASIDNELRSSGQNGFSSNMDKPTSYRLQAGWKFNKNLAIEGGYLGSNSVDYSANGGTLLGGQTASAKFHGWNLVAVGTVPLNYGFSLLGKVGASQIKENATVQPIGASTDGSKTDLTYGIGVKYDINPLVFVRADLDSYNIGDSNSTSRSRVGTINVGFNF